MPRSRSPEDSEDEYYKKKKKKKSKSKDREKRSRSRERSRSRDRSRERDKDRDKEKKHKDKKHKDKKHKRDKSESPELTPAEKFSIFKKQREAAGKGENIVVDDMFKDFISAKLKQIQTDTASIPNNEEDSKSKKKSSVEEMKKFLDSELSSINSAPVKQELDTKISDHKKTENKHEVSKSSANVTAIKQEPTESNNSKNSVNGATSVQSNISDKVKVESGVAAIPMPMPRPKPPASESDAVFTMAAKPIMKPVMGFGSMLPRTLAVKEEKKEETSTEKKESESDGKKPALGFKNFGIKLSLTSTELIQSGAQFKKGKRLEDGEVLSSSDSDGSKSSDTEPEVDDNNDDENEISGTGSINDSDDETKVKKKKKKKKKGKHKKKKSKEKEKEKEKEVKEDVLVVGPDKPGEKRKVFLGSRSRSKSPKKSKQSRSISKERTNRSPSKEKSSKSKDRSKRSRSKEKSKRSRSKDRSKRSRSRDKSKRSRSRERSKKNRSRSNSRSRKRRSRSRSKGRRSRSRDRRSRERSSRKGRSRSRSKDRRRSRSRSPFKPWRSSRYGDFDAYRFSSRKPKSRSVTPDKESDKFKERERKRLEDLRCKIDKAKLREIAMKNALESAKTTGTEVAVTIKAGGKSVAELTEYCKKITDQEKAKRLARGEEVSSSDEDVSGLYPNSDDDDAQTFKAREPGAIVMDIKNAKQLPLATPQERLAQAGQLRLQFPVSSGSQHRDKEWVPVEKPEPVKPTPGTSKSLPFPAIEHKVFEEPAPAPNVDISSIVSERLNAVRKLQENPHDFAAKQILSQAQQKASQWAQSKHLPGQFLGSTGASVMSQEELIGNKKRQAWIKKDVFTSAAPVTSGIGMFLLKKMGWKHGEGLGKNNEGQKEPLMLDFKVDRKGLVTTGEGKKGAQAQKVPKVTIAKDLSGKHPVSALGEFCNRRKWGIPRYELVHESGPSHKKDFCFKVLVNGAWYQPQISSNNKKLAKAAAATTCLQELGMVPREQT